MRRLPLWCAVLVVVSLPGVGSAEWLVTTDGARIETAGPWSKRAEFVVFRDTRGVLSSIRRSAIDLQASLRSSRPAAPVLTDRDIARGPYGAEGNAGRGGSAPSGRVKRYSVDDLVVDRWTRERQREIGGFEIAGDLRNATGHGLHSLGMWVVCSTPSERNWEQGRCT